MRQKKHSFGNSTSDENIRRPKKMDDRSQEVTKGFGLLAIGSSRGWDVSIDESVGGEQRWYAQIEGPSFSLYFQLLEAGIVRKVIDFLDMRDSDRPGSRTELNHELSHELTIGLFSRARVSLLWDDEFRDRCFLVIGPKSRSSIRITFSADETKALREALWQLNEDLAHEEQSP